MNCMKRYSTNAIFLSALLVLSIFTLISISEVNAEEVISVNAKGYENTIIIEFENESTSKIKTIRIWAGGEVTFTSFKSEPGWGGGKYSNGKLLIFTATNTLNPGESVKFGLVTDEKVNAMNWKVLDRNDNDIDKGKTSIQVISETSSDIIEEESKEVEQAKETGGELYGTKKFIPEKIRSGSDVRLVGSGFGSEKNLKLYLDSTILKSVNTDKQGNFLTTISIPDTHNIGTSEFIIKDESDNIQTTSINVEESKNRFLKTSNFEVNSVPAEIRYEETLTISGSAYPQSAIIIAFENNERVLEKIRVVSANANGEWVFEETIERTDNLGEKFVIFKNNNDKTTKSLTVKSDYLIQISTSAVRYNAGEAVTITGTAEPNNNTTVWVKDQNNKIVLYDVFTSNADGSLNYEFVTDEIFSSGTYTVIIRQGDGSDGALFGIVFAYSRNSLPEGHTVKKTFVLAAIMWFTIFLIPFLKYPANPPTVGDADTVVLRGILYLSFIAISGFSAVGFSRLYKKLENKKYLAFVGYAVFITAVFFIMPPSPDEVTAPMDLVNGFRAMSVMAVTTFWIAEAIILGLLWQKYKTKLQEP